MTAVEWFFDELTEVERNLINKTFLQNNNSLAGYKLRGLFEQAKAMEKEQSHKYSEFAIRCDRKDMKILNFEDWIKLETFKSE